MESNPAISLLAQVSRAEHARSAEDNASLPPAVQGRTATSGSRLVKNCRHSLSLDRMRKGGESPSPRPPRRHAEAAGLRLREPESDLRPSAVKNIRKCDRSDRARCSPWAGEGW